MLTPGSFCFTSLNPRERSPSSCLCNCRKLHRKLTAVSQTDCDSAINTCSRLTVENWHKCSNMLAYWLVHVQCISSNQNTAYIYLSIHAYWLLSHPIRTLLMLHCPSVTSIKCGRAEDQAKMHESPTKCRRVGISAVVLTQTCLQDILRKLLMYVVVQNSFFY